MGQTDHATLRGPIRMAILDDSPFVRWADGGLRSADATFHRFAEAVVRLGPFRRASYVVPVRDALAGHDIPDRDPVDEDVLEIVPSAPFDGIRGYLRGSPSLVRRNWPVMRRSAASADLCWIKAPASNATLMALACRRAGTPRFTYVAGSVRAVAAAQTRPLPMKAGALAVGTAYDAVTRILRASGPSVVLDDELFTSVVRDEDVAATPVDRPVRPEDQPIRLVWAGRVIDGKGLDELIGAVGRSRSEGMSVELELIGDGPDRARLEALSARAGLRDSVHWAGSIEDRTAYFDALRRADIFVSPSRAEGVPKTVIEAMAAGVPVIAVPTGAIARVLDHGRRGRLAPSGSADALATSIRELIDAPEERSALRATGLRWARDRTDEAQAARLVTWLSTAFPYLPWHGGRTE